MSIESVARNRLESLERLGKLALNVQFPNDFEVYMCALELVDGTGKTLKYFIFPVMPSSLEEIRPEITNVKKTLSGVSSLSTPTFVPADINLAGTFGRKFRVLLGSNEEDLTSAFNSNTNLLGKVTSHFDVRVKTGYGCCKILQEIVDASKLSDENGLRRLYFYNPALGNNYVVKPMQLRFSQTQENNMMWNYSLPLKAIAPLESVMSAQEQKKQRLRLNTTGYLQYQLDRAVSSLTKALSDKDNKDTNRLKETLRIK